MGDIMIKLMHFISDTNIGGAGKLLCNQIKNMAGSDFEISVALPNDSALISELQSLPCTLIKCKSGADTSFSHQSFIEDYNLIKKLRPDIVHSHGSLSSRIAATALGIPTRIFTRHCIFPIAPSIKSPIIRQSIGKVNNFLSTSMISVADSARQNLVDMGCDEQKIVTIINGVDPLRITSDLEKEYLRAKYGLKKRDFVISIFARLEKYKGHSTLLRAAQICKRYYPNFRFLVVGNGTQRNNLTNLAQELGVSEIVCFTGFCDDVAPLFNITDINVNCSYESETSSLSLCEGMSIGIPTVASDCGGNLYMVKNAVNGLLFPKENADALAMALIRLYRDRELYQKCSEGALKRYKEEFTAQAMTEKMMNFYKKEYLKNKK